MRIGKKYQFDGIFKEAVERLKAPFPKSLGAMTDDRSQFPGWVMADFEDIASLCEEMAIWSILPFTYYLVTCYEGTVVSQRSMICAPNTDHLSLVWYSRGSFVCIQVSR